MDEKYPGSERRNSSRERVIFTVIYRVKKPIEVIMVVGGKKVSATMIDLSSAGMAVSTSYDSPVATELALKFTLINPYAKAEEQVKVMEMVAVVRNNIPGEGNNYRIGVAFTEIKEEDKDAISKFVLSTSKKV